MPGDQLDLSQYLPAPGFHILPRRWVVERTFAWLSHNRRLSKDYERKSQTSETLIELTIIHVLVRRLAGHATVRT